MSNWIEIYCDGSCVPNPGHGGWAAILRYGNHEKEIFGSVDDTTNNRMEMMAAIEALKALKKPCLVAIYTDSQYLMLGITKYLDGWRKRNWRKADGKPVKNKDLWEELHLEINRHIEVMWNWVRGHSGHPQNERADYLSLQAARRESHE